jgi:hypothetical protein
MAPSLGNASRPAATVARCEPEVGRLITFNADRHEYHLGDRRLPSVTEVLKAITNFDMVPPDILEAARLFGHHVHLACHYFNLGELDEPTLHPRLAPRIRGYKRFLHQTKFKVLASEEVVHSADFAYAGMLDLRGTFHGKYSLVDLKSGAVPRSVGPQTAGYQRACREPPRRRWCLQLLDDDFRLIPCNGLGDWAMFQSCLNIWNFNNAKSKSRRPEDRAA